MQGASAGIIPTFARLRWAKSVSEVFAPHDCIVSRFSFATFLAEEKSGEKRAAAALLSLKI
jgi:hypothetical protein